MTLTLNIVPDIPYNWINHPTYYNACANHDVGLDIPMNSDITVPGNTRAFKVDMGFKANQTHGYMLVPRSSISKTPLRLANSIGIIDKNYTGKVLVKLDNVNKNDFILKSGECYFQIVAFDGNLPKFNIVDNVQETRRGSGGFGSTTR